MTPTEQAMRDVFAEELAKVGETRLADMVRSGDDNSNGGKAAVAALIRVANDCDQRMKETLTFIRDECTKYLKTAGAGAGGDVVLRIQRKAIEQMPS